MPWFHGGKPGLNVGDELLPPSQTGNATLLAYCDDWPDPERRAFRVFLTRDPRDAASYAAVLPGGDVYEAVPIGPTEPDPGCIVPGHAIQCARARIIRVTRRGVTLDYRGAPTRGRA